MFMKRYVIDSGILNRMNLRRFFVEKIHVVCLLFIVSFACAFGFYVKYIPNPTNPLSTKTSLHDVFLRKYFVVKAQWCVTHTSGRELFSCINAVMRKVSGRYGARLALDIIEEVSQKYPTLQGWGHDLSHTIGDNALYAGTGLHSGRAIKDESVLITQIGKTIIACDGWGSFGCYHGVIEIGMSHIAPGDRARVVRKACLENPLVTSRLYYVNQCMHWFGHGMAIFTDQTLEQTLHMCEGVSPSFGDDPVQLCLSGVFHAGAMPGTTDPTMLQNVSRLFDPADVYFPCAAVEERFRGHCYSHIPGRSKTGDVSVMMHNCDNIPERDFTKKDMYVRGCYESIGNNLLINGKYTAQGVSDQCLQSSMPRYYGYCFGGAARYAGLRDPLLNNTIPFDICASAPDSAKATCFALVGFANFENYKSFDILKSYCSRVEPRYRNACEHTNPE